MSHHIQSPGPRFTENIEKSVLIKSNIWTQIRENSTFHLSEMSEVSGFE